MNREDNEKDRSGFGLGSNIRHVMNITDWDLATVAFLMFPYTSDTTVQLLRRSLAQLLRRPTQRSWVHSAAFARALGLSEWVCLYTDLRTYPTIVEFKEHFGLDPENIVTRSERIADTRNTWQEASKTDLHKVLELYRQFGKVRATRHKLERSLFVSGLAGKKDDDPEQE